MNKGLSVKYSVFYLNLDKDIKRREYMDRQLSRLGFSFERISGILGKNIKDNPEYYNENLAISLNGAPLSDGELGCSASHILAYKKIVDENIGYALIFEDDVVLPNNFKEIIDSVLSKNNSFDYLLFDYPPVGFWFIKYWCNMTIKAIKNKPSYLFYAILKAPYIISLSLYEGFRNNYMPSGPKKFLRPLYFAGAYIITLDGAKKMLSLSKPIVYPADRLPNQARVKAGLVFRGYTPLVVHQDRTSFESNIA